jgi:hypothetical protein
MNIIEGKVKIKEVYKGAILKKIQNSIFLLITIPAYRGVKG